METTQGNSLCIYLYLKLAKLPCFSFYIFYFFFYKIREPESRTVSAWWRKRKEGWHGWEGEVVGKGLEG
jgi:hypothetical protein